MATDKKPKENEESKTTRPKIKEKERMGLQNQFILFYTLRELWKLFGNETGGLYTILFPSNNRVGGNKTKYDNILKLQNVNLLSQSSQLASLTGLSETYFTGERRLSVGHLTVEDWNKFIQCRKSTRASYGDKSKELRAIERKVKDEIRTASENPERQSEPFRRLMYFAKYRQKRADKTLQDKFKDIERAIDELQPTEFRQAELESLKKHQEKIQSYFQRITAVAIMLQWENEQN